MSSIGFQPFRWQRSASIAIRDPTGHRESPMRRLKRIIAEVACEQRAKRRTESLDSTIAPKPKRQKEFKALSKMVGALLNTQTDRLQTPVARARRKGLAFDPQRSELFEQLRAKLHRALPHIRLASPSDATTLPFFEAYFSNFIEGAEFEVEEAAAIIFENRIPNARPQDAHNIIGTYRIVSNETEMQRTPHTFAELERLLKHRHATIIASSIVVIREIPSAIRAPEIASTRIE